MFKKSLYLGSVTLILLALIALSGCSNPALDGPSGAPGRESYSGTVSAATLKELFAVNDTVELLTGSASATAIAGGEVPAGKTLEISGEVDLTGILEVTGVLDIKSGGDLSASAGKLYLGRNGRVLVNGFVYLEQELFQDQPIATELSNGEVDFDPRVTVNAATGGLSLPAGVVPVGVNNYFTKVNNLKWAATTPLTTATLPVLTNWTRGKTLTLNAAAITTTSDIDVSDKGTLIINGTGLAPANLTLGAFTLKASSTTQNIIVGTNGSITLNDNASALAGKIRVEGGLVTSVNAPVIRLPVYPDLDLTKATLSADADGDTFYFADTEYPIGTIDVSEASLVLRESRGLSIRSVTNVGGTGAETLTIPPSVTTTITEVLTDGTNVLTIASTNAAINQYALLKPGFVSGIAGLTLGQFLSLQPIDNGSITVAADSNIAAAALAALGSTNADQSAVLGKIRGGKVNLTAGPTITGAEPITINTVLATATITIAADTTFNVAPAITGAITINNGKNLILASEVEIARTALTLTEGVYQAVGGDITIAGTGTIETPAVINAGLKIGTSVAGIAENFISLTSATDAAVTDFTPVVSTANGHRVQIGKGGITIPGDDTTGAALQAPGTGRITVAGEKVNITLGAGAASGVLGLLENALLVAADVLTADDGTSPPAAGDYAASAALKAETNAASDGIDITARTAADGAVITGATKSAP